MVTIGQRKLDRPLVIAEVGINHDGDFDLACEMARLAAETGCECVKFQCHVPDDEMSPEARDVVPPNADESIYDIMARCAFTEEQDAKLKRLTEGLGMIYLCTPFGRAAVQRLGRMGVVAYKIGSGECNNFPLVSMIAARRLPVILSTGMNGLPAISKAVRIVQDAGAPLVILHCTSLYPTPYADVRLGAIAELQREFYGVPVGLSDHSLGIYTSLAAVALGAMVIEKHFTIDRGLPGPDNVISITPPELHDLIDGAQAIHDARGGHKTVLEAERDVIAFAHASVVTVRDIRKGERMTGENLWVKRPGGGIPAELYESIIDGHKHAAQDIPADVQLAEEMIA